MVQMVGAEGVEDDEVFFMGCGIRGRVYAWSSSRVLGLEVWSGWSFKGRASRVERKDLVKVSSVMMAVDVEREGEGESGDTWVEYDGVRGG